MSLTPLLPTGTFEQQGSFTDMMIDQKFSTIRKGLLEFLILKIVSADKVYVADMLQRLSTTDFTTQEGTLYPLLSKMRREDLVNYDWQESDAGPPRKYYKLTAAGKKQLAEFNDYWKSLNTLVNQLGR
jgi:PadR family transcriptional regulator PadR